MSKWLSLNEFISWTLFALVVWYVCAYQSDNLVAAVRWLVMRIEG